MKKFYLFKTIILLCALVVGSGSVWADNEPTQIFYESFGSTSSNTSVSSYTGYSATASMFTTTGNVNTHYSGSGSVGKYNLSDANLSSGYTGASGLSGCYHTGTANTQATIIQISNINIEGYTNLALSFGALGGSTSHKVNVSYKIDNGSETTLISNGSITNANWTLLSANISGTGKSLTLYITHTPTKAWTIRLDDIKITGTETPSGPVNLTSFGFSKSTDEVTLVKDGNSFVAEYTQAVTVDPTTYDGTITYSIDETSSTIPNDMIVTVSNAGKVEIAGDSNTGASIVVKASGEATNSYNKPADATYILTVNAAILGTPVFEPVAGSYYYGQKITATAANAEGIVYTTTGDDPTDESDEWPAEGYTLTATTTLKAMAYDSELNFSEVTTAVYTLKVPEVPTFSIEGGEVKSGTTLTLTPGEGGVFVVYTTDGSDPDENSNIVYADDQITISEACTIKAATIDEGGNLSSIVSYTFTIKQSVVYEKLTSADDLAEGDKVIIVSTTSTVMKVMGSLNNAYFDAVDVTIDNNEITDPVNANVLELEGTTGAWYFKQTSDNKYILSSGTSASIGDKGDAGKTTISFNNGNAIIIFPGGQWYYNASSPRFRVYTSTQTNVQLYRLKKNLADNSITLSPSTAQILTLGGTKTVTVTASATNNGAITAISSDETIATVTDNSNGTYTITAVSGTEQGTDVTITFSTPKTATHKAAQKTLTVTVKEDRAECPISYAEATVTKKVDEATSYTGQSLTFAAGAEGISVSYAIAGDNIGTIDENTGVLTLFGTEGTATITATFNGNDNYQPGTVSYTLNVYEPVVFTEFFEDFNTQNSVGGNNGNFGEASSTALTSFGSWTLNSVYAADRCVKVGKSGGGSITTPELKLDPTVKYVLMFKAAPWTNDGTNLTLNSADAIFDGVASTTVSMPSNNWGGFYVELTNGSADTKITFTPAKRMFFDEVRVMEKSAFEALSLNQTVSSNGWATYIPAYNVNFEEGDAYVVTDVDQTTSTITIEEVTEAPAKTPVLLKGAGDKTIIAATTKVEAPVTNLLSISDGTSPATGYTYVLAKDGDGAGFKQWTSTANTLTGRVVLVLDFAQASEARMLRFVEGEAQGVSDIKIINDNHYYDLQGRSVAHPTKGLYIVNGKKVVMK